MRAAIPVLLFMAGFQGYVLTLPLFGPLLFQLAAVKGADPVQAATSFLNCYALSFLVWGIVLHKWQPGWKWCISLTYAIAIGCLVLTISLWWLAASYWNILFALIGLVASLPSLVWIFLIRQLIPRHQIGLAFGINGVLVGGLHFVYNVSGVGPQTGMLAVFGMLGLAMVALSRFWKVRLQPEPLAASFRKRSNPMPLFLFIFIVFLLGGIMYQVVNPFLAEFPGIHNYFEKMTYIMVMPLVGWFVDRRGFKSVVYGLAFLGLGYAVFAFSTSFQAALLGSGLLQIGFAFLDVFVLYALSIWADRKRPFLFIGAGLAVYILSIRTGLSLRDVIVPLSLGNYQMTFMAALIILLISLLLVHWLGDQEPREVEKQQLLEKLEAYYNEKDEELKLAGKIQQQMLPVGPQLPEGVEAVAFLAAAKEVAGDFYDIIVVDKHTVLFIVGDVTDKGLPAALIMSNIVGLIRSEAQRRQNLPEMLKQLNRALYKEHSMDMLVTLGIAMVDLESETITYASAGHVSPLIMKKDQVEFVPSSSFPIGLDEDLEPYVVSMPISRHDTFVLYTDGIVEVENAERQLFGFERLKLVLDELATCDHTADQVKNRILEQVKLFSQERAQRDDMTLLVIRMNG
ncbi:SpoIIE family protein phosphatase [Paenibacillus thalictri]|uniref:PPM-type phosphatase domain-containing protein n=1 Tax=Paenibacillus thalictri TaxID=2527873 RepID=A0A4Q9DJM7_9BACL|nr:SpoIIE family protein phosphatase [Paenibacillus thalictri]TBL72644.1 hypothetical protein EYB31_28225 [Paenibacillus thalictri]